MEPISIALLIGQLLLKYGPDVAEATHNVFKKMNPDVDIGEWGPVFDKSRTPYAFFVGPNPPQPPS